MEKLSFLNNLWILIPLIVWILSLKGIALWKAARQNQKIWFVFLLVLNTLGFLEIIYIFYVGERKEGGIVLDGETEKLTKKKIV